MNKHAKETRTPPYYLAQSLQVSVLKLTLQVQGELDSKH